MKPVKNSSIVLVINTHGELLNEPTNWKNVYWHSKVPRPGALLYNRVDGNDLFGIAYNMQKWYAKLQLPPTTTDHLNFLNSYCNLLNDDTFGTYQTSIKIVEEPINHILMTIKNIVTIIVDVYVAIITFKRARPNVEGPNLGERGKIGETTESNQTGGTSSTKSDVFAAKNNSNFDFGNPSINPDNSVSTLLLIMSSDDSLGSDLSSDLSSDLLLEKLDVLKDKGFTIWEKLNSFFAPSGKTSGPKKYRTSISIQTKIIKHVDSINVWIESVKTVMLKVRKAFPEILEQFKVFSELQNLESLIFDSGKYFRDSSISQCNQFREIHYDKRYHFDKKDVDKTRIKIVYYSPHSIDKSSASKLMKKVFYEERNAENNDIGYTLSLAVKDDNIKLSDIITKFTPHFERIYIYDNSCFSVNGIDGVTLNTKISTPRPGMKRSSTRKNKHLSYIHLKIFDENHPVQFNGLNTDLNTPKVNNISLRKKRKSETPTSATKSSTLQQRGTKKQKRAKSSNSKEY
jgi:hypothetical protein